MFLQFRNQEQAEARTHVLKSGPVIPNPFLQHLDGFEFRPFFSRNAEDDRSHPVAPIDDVSLNKIRLVLQKVAARFDLRILGSGPGMRFRFTFFRSPGGKPKPGESIALGGQFDETESGSDSAGTAVIVDKVVGQALKIALLGLPHSGLGDFGVPLGQLADKHEPAQEHPINITTKAIWKRRSRLRAFISDRVEGTTSESHSRFPWRGRECVLHPVWQS